MISEARTFAGISGCGGAAGVTSAYGDGVVLQAASAEHATATSGQAKRIPIEYLPSLRPAASGAKTPSLRTDPHSNRSVNMPATPPGVPRTPAGPLDPVGIGARIGPGQGRCEAARWNPAGLQQRSGPAETGSRFCRGAPLERDDFSSNRHPALAFWWSMIFFRKPVPTFRDHALAPASLRAGNPALMRDVAPSTRARLRREAYRAGRFETGRPRAW